VAITIESTKLLAVEGKDACNFFDTLLKKIFQLMMYRLLTLGE
jgi:hypothetical protein